MWQIISFLIIFCIVIVWPIWSWWKETDAEEELHKQWRKEAEEKRK